MPRYLGGTGPAARASGTRSLPLYLSGEVARARAAQAQAVSAPPQAEAPVRPEVRAAPSTAAPEGPAPVPPTPPGPAEATFEPSVVAPGEPPVPVDATTVGGGQVLARMRDAASAGREAFSRRVTDGADALLDELGQARTDVADAGQSAVEDAQACFTEARGDVQSSVAAQREAVDAAAVARQEEVSSWTEGAVERGSTLISDAQQSARDDGDSHAEQAETAGPRIVDEARQQVEQRAQRAEATGERLATGQGGTPEQAQARAQAARLVAGDTAEHLRDDLADGLDAEESVGEDVAASFRDQAEDFAEQLGQQEEALTSHLEGLGVQTEEGLSAAREQGAVSFEQAGTELCASLEQQEAGAVSSLRERTEGVRSDLADASEQVSASVEQSAADMLVSGEQALAQVAEQVALLSIPEEEAGEVGEALAGEVERAYGEAGEQVCTALEGNQEPVRMGAQETLASFDQAGDELSSHLDESTDQVDTTLVGRTEQLTSQMDTGVTNMTGAMDGSIDSLEGGIQTRTQSLDTEYGQCLEKVESGLHEQVDPAVAQATEAVDSLPSRISEAQTTAAARAERSWLEQQWDDFAEMAGDWGFWGGLLTGVVLGALVIALAPAELGLLAVLGIGALIGGVAALVGTVLSNIQHERPLGENLLQSVLMGAVFGAVGAVVLVGATSLVAVVLGSMAVGGVLGWIGNLISGAPWDKGLLANILLGGLLALAGKLYVRYRGIRLKGQPPPPEQAPPPPEQQVPPPVPVAGETPAPAPEVPAPAPVPAAEVPTPQANESAPSVSVKPGEPVISAASKVAKRSDGTFRLNRKNISHSEKIVGEPESRVLGDANREAVAAELAAQRPNVERVYMGTEADRFINGTTGEKMSADVVATTKNAEYFVYEAKGSDITHGLEQLEYTASKLGSGRVRRQTIVTKEKITTPGYTTENGVLMFEGKPVLIDGKPVYIKYTSQ